MKAALVAGVCENLAPEFSTLKSIGNQSCDCGVEKIVSDLYKQVGKTAALKATKIVGRMDVALEIVQETFLKLWKSKLTFPDKKAAFIWIYKTTHNASIDYIRLAMNKNSSLDHCATSDLASILPNTSIEERQLIMHATSQLNEREVQILIYVMVDGMTQGEIADVIGVSRKTVVRDWQKIEEKLTAFRKEFS